MINSASILLLVLLTGCVTKYVAKVTPIETLPQMAIVSRALTVAPPVATRLLLWEKGDNNYSTVTQVWHTTNLLDWELYGEFSAPRCTFTTDKPMQFFKIRNRLGEKCSDWARNLQ